MFDTPPGRSSSALRQGQGHEDPAAVEILVADVEDAPHLQQLVAAIGQGHAQLVVHADAQVLGQLAADHRPRAFHGKAAGTMYSSMRTMRR
jgi:hypothetical protein